MPISTRVLTSLILFLFVHTLFSCEDPCISKYGSDGENHVGSVNVDFVTSTTVSLSWKMKSEAFEKYVVTRNDTAIVTITDPNVKSYVDYNLKPNTFYSYMVYRYNLCTGFTASGQSCWTLPE